LKLGLENRYYYPKIPFNDEMNELLNLAYPNILGKYVIDHTQALEVLGFYPHQERLSRFSHRIFSVYIHDVTSQTDDFTPGLGDTGLKSIADDLPFHATNSQESLATNSFTNVSRGMEKFVDTGSVNNR
jgi:hypothetical protein